MTGCKDSEIGHAKNSKGFKPEPVKPVGDGATSIFHTICGAFSQIVLWNKPFYLPLPLILAVKDIIQGDEQN